MASSAYAASTTATVGHVIMDEIAAIVGALVGGAKYGIKIRAPHALVMTLMFRNDLDSKQKIRNIVKVVLEHASNLAAFATIYKTVLAILKWSSRYLHQHSNGNKGKDNISRSWGRIVLQLIIDGPLSFTTKTKQQNYALPTSMAGHPERPYHSLVAGGVGGYCVWGRYSSVNHQIVLYLTSRILVGLTKRLWEHVHGTPHHHPTSLLQHKQTYPLLAATVWGIVMVLFEESPHVLHSSLKKSMEEIYRFKIQSFAATSNVSDAATEAIGGGGK
jgi:peroxisomal membrane protein 4